MSVKLREKELSNGQVSLYLDVYQNGKRSYEFLDIYVNRKKPTPEDSQKYKLALEIRAQREHDTIVVGHALVDKKKARKDFVDFFIEHMSKKSHNNQRTATLYQLKRFVGKKSLPITGVTLEWLKNFERFMLETVSVNSVLTYMQNINGALNALVRSGVIARNPWHEVPFHERLKKTETIRTAWTIEQLQLLANTPCQINEQYKVAFLFSCFTGLRWGDVNGLQWSNIKRQKVKNQEQWYIHFKQRKTQTIEFLPLTNQAVQILKEQEYSRDENSIYVFPQVKETHSRTHLVHRRVDLAIKKWAKTAGLNEKKMRFHTARHSYATNMLEATNGDLYTVSKLLGHKNVKTTQIYAQVRDRMKQEAVDAFSKITFRIGNNSEDSQAA
jgi:integrase